MAIEARNRTLPDWFTRIRTRQLALPRFQRFEAWEPPDIANLFNTILRGLPVGSVLVLDVGNIQPFICRTLKGAPESTERVTEHLLDGQQRLTALWRGLNNNYEERTYFLYLDPDPETGMPHYINSIARHKRDGDTELRPFWANKPKEQWRRRMIPLQLLLPDVNSQPAFRVWANEAVDDQVEREELSDQVSEIRQRFLAFNLPFLSLPVTTAKEVALDVFLKMNTSAAPLTTYDIVVAQLEAELGVSLHDLVAEIKGVSPLIANYYSPEDLVLYSTALLVGKPPTNSTYLSRDFGEQLLANWDKLLTGIPRAVAFLEEERIFDSARLPTDVVVPVLCALWAVAPDGLDAEGRTRSTLRKYIWRAFFSNRYERTTNTRSFVDFNELRPLVTGSGDGVPVIFDETQHPLPSAEELLTAGWPGRKERIARAIMAVSLRHGGLDLADGGSATRESLKKREYHHLFPVAHLARLNVPESDAFVALNCALVTWRTNRNISDKEPERYLAERLDGIDLGEDEVRARLTSHVIPFDELISGNYRAFLEARATLVVASMKALCEGRTG